MNVFVVLCFVDSALTPVKAGKKKMLIMELVELQRMQLFLVSDRIPKYLEVLGLYDLVPFPSDMFPEHFNHEFREDALYQKLDELAEHLYDAEGRYCVHREDEVLYPIEYAWECFIPIDENGKYRKISDLTRKLNCSGYGQLFCVVGNADFSKYLWVVGEYLPSNRSLPPKGEDVVPPNLEDM